MYLLFRPKHKIIYIRLSEFSNARISFVFPLERLPHWIKKKLGQLSQLLFSAITGFLIFKSQSL